MKKHFGTITFDIINNMILCLCSLVAFIPFFMVIIASFTEEKYLMRDGYSLLPKGLSLTAYKLILGKGTSVYDGYRVSIIMTVVGTLFSIIIVSMMAYAASRKTLKYRNFISMVAYWPLVFNAGLVPFYMVLIKLGLKNTMIGLIIPMLMSPMNVFIMLNHFRSIPDALLESAKIDGASEFRTYWNIVMPLSGPVTASVALFVMLQYWNDWVLGLFLIEDQKLYPLQFLLRQIMSRATYVQQQAVGMSNSSELPQESVKMATVIVTLGPIVFVYPFIQKYFVKGITIGAVKG